MEFTNDLAMKNVEILSGVLISYKIGLGILEDIDGKGPPTKSDEIMFDMLVELDRSISKHIIPVIETYNSNAAIRDLLDDINEN